jgi:hypothetical protein
MKIKEFIKWLETQDQDAIIKVVAHKSGRGYYDQGGTASKVEFDPSNHVEITDFRGNSFVTPDDDFYNKIHILLGTHND